MKNFLKISSVLVRVSCLLIILAFGVGFLIRSVNPAFAGGRQENFPKPKSSVGPEGLKILYVNIDTVDLKYKAFTDLSDKAGVAYEAKSNEYKKKALVVQQRYDKLIQQSNMGLITPAQYKFEEFLINIQVKEMEVIEAELQEMEELAMQQNAAITDGIMLYLKSFGIGKKVDYILAYGGTSGVLYANPDFDVTDEVVSGLNSQYNLKGK